MIGNETGGAAPAAPEKKQDTAAPDAEDEENKEMVSKKEMEGAMDAAIKQVREDAARTQREIRDAERAVKPYVGELEVAFDSAPQVYAKALEILGVDTKGVHESALPAILRAQPVPGSKTEKTPAVAMDAASVESYSKMFPSAARIGQA
jgi:hypothetical protein